MELLSAMEIDAIGEILNISMGSAATAISTMLDKQVIITTPKVSIKEFDAVDYSNMEPALVVKITYVEGIKGSNVMVFRQRDMQMILNQLMGIEDPPSDEFVFDELSMSAASEVMNQMMGASATALSSFLGKSINISTPTASVIGEDLDLKAFSGYEGKEDIVSVVFNLKIQDIMDTEFISVLSHDLAKLLVGQFMVQETDEHGETQVNVQIQEQGSHDQHRKMTQSEIEAVLAAQSPREISTPPKTGQGSLPQNEIEALMSAHSKLANESQRPVPQSQPYPEAPTQPYAVPPHGGYPPQGPSFPYGYPPYGYYPPFPLHPQPPYPGEPKSDRNVPEGVLKESVNVQPVQFPQFGSNRPGLMNSPIAGGNMDLIMNVPLNVSVEIGKTKRKIKDILDFAQGTVIELEKQAGAPVDIVVNGQLIARGDVVVIEDNFGVRVTEILGIQDVLAQAEAQKEQ